MTLNLSQPRENGRLEFRRLAALGVAIAGFVIVTPFVVNNLLQGRYVLGGVSTAIIVVLGMNAWSTANGNYRPWFTFATLVPAIIGFLFLSILRQEIIGVLWCYPSMIALVFMLPERLGRVAMAALVVVVGLAASQTMDAGLVARIIATLLGVGVFAAIFIRVIERQQSNLEALATTDTLTGLSNRTLMDGSLARYVEQSRRAGAPLTVVTLDIDHFKRINDTFGHAAGDAVLRKVGGLLADRVRRSDHVFRLGGEEFLLVLNNAGPEDGFRVAEELRTSLSRVTSQQANESSDNPSDRAGALSLTQARATSHNPTGGAGDPDAGDLVEDASRPGEPTAGAVATGDSTTGDLASGGASPNTDELTWHISASFGVATLRDGEEWSELLKRSDDALYRAKREGRNRTVSDAPADPDGPSNCVRGHCVSAK